MDTHAGWLGVDVGWVYPAADSLGTVYTWSTAEQRRTARRDYPRASDVTVTKADGTSYTIPAYNPRQIADMVVKDPDVLLRRCRGVASMVVTKAFQAGYGVALEQWDDDDRQSRWKMLHREIIRTCVERSVPYIIVNRAYTSQTCPECGHCSEDNRRTRGRFTCEECGHRDHADRVAARNIAARAEARSPSEEGVVQPGRGEKRCVGCRHVLPLVAFARSKVRSGKGRVSRCRNCRNPGRTWTRCSVDHCRRRVELNGSDDWGPYRCDQHRHELALNH